MLTHYQAIREWWLETGPVVIQAGAVVTPKGEDEPGRMFFGVRAAYYFTNKILLPKSTVTFVYHTPKTLLMGDVITYKTEEGRQAWQVTDPSLPCHPECGDWEWKQRRVYYPATVDEANNSETMTIQMGGDEVIRTIRPTFDPRALRQRHKAISRAIADVIIGGHPEKWSGRIITTEWVENNLPKGNLEAGIGYLADLAIFGLGE